MKRILELLILVVVIASVGALASCTPREDPAPPQPDPPKAQSALGTPAETRAEAAAADARFWRTAAALLLAGLCAAFIGGTAIGSKGKRHANS